MLMSYLNNHHNVHIVGELQDFPKHSVAYLERFLNGEVGITTRFMPEFRKKDVHHVGINIPTEYLCRIRMPRLKSIHPNVKFLYLYRESIINSYLSNVMAEQSKRYHDVRGDYDVDGSIHFDPANYNQYFTRQKRNILRISEKVNRKGLKELTFISYENILKNPNLVNEIYKRLFDLTYDGEFVSRFKKMHTNHLGLVENKSALDQVLPVKLRPWTLQDRIDSILKSAVEEWKNRLNAIDLNKQEIT